MSMPSLEAETNASSSPVGTGLAREAKREPLPRLAKTAKADPQAMHYFLANAE